MQYYSAFGEAIIPLCEQSGSAAERLARPRMGASHGALTTAQSGRSWPVSDAMRMLGFRERHSQLSPDGVPARMGYIDPAIEGHQAARQMAECVDRRQRMFPWSAPRNPRLSKRVAA